MSEQPPRSPEKLEAMGIKPEEMMTDEQREASKFREEVIHQSRAKKLREIALQTFQELYGRNPEELLRGTELKYEFKPEKNAKNNSDWESEERLMAITKEGKTKITRRRKVNMVWNDNPRYLYRRERSQYHGKQLGQEMEGEDAEKLFSMYTDALGFVRRDFLNEAMQESSEETAKG